MGWGTSWGRVWGGSSEVVSSDVSVSLTSYGRLLITLKARTNFGSMDLSLPVTGLGEGVQL